MAVGGLDGRRVSSGIFDGAGLGPDGELVGALVGPEGAADGAGVIFITSQLVLPLEIVVVPAAQETQGGCPEGLK